MSNKDRFEGKRTVRVDPTCGHRHDGHVTNTSSDQPAYKDVSKLDPARLVDGFASTLGLRITQTTPDLVEGEWRAPEDLGGPAGTVHRGVHSSVIETLASIGAAVWLGERGKVVGVNNNSDFFDTSPNGTFTSTATPVHRDRDQQLWLVETLDDAGTPVARGQVRLQNLYPDA
jgi:1,4-dihydroxy-2-naphthoyl-CoA hydrolase